MKAIKHKKAHRMPLAKMLKDRLPILYDKDMQSFIDRLAKKKDRK